MVTILLSFILGWIKDTFASKCVKWLKRKYSQLVDEQETKPVRKESKFAEKLATLCPICEEWKAYRHWPARISLAYSKANCVPFDACWKCWDERNRKDA